MSQQSSAEPSERENQIELKVRRILAGEIDKHREFLERQFMIDHRIKSLRTAL